MNIVDKLIEKTIETKNPTVIGLDPDISKFPACYKTNNNNANPLSAVAEVIYKFNCDIIDTVAELVPAVKPQMAFYENMGLMVLQHLKKLFLMQNQKDLL